MNEDKSEFLICDCQGHGLLVERFEGEDEVSISLFERGLNGRILNWKERLRWCWQIFKNGSPWSDFVILNVENQKKLRKFLNEPVK